MITKVALIGGGPACATAAIQLFRSGIDVILISKEIGGTIKNANLIENLIGYPEGIVGIEFAKLFQRQLTAIGVPIVLEEVTEVTQCEGKYHIITPETEIVSDYLIIGTGSVPKRLNVEGEEKAFFDGRLFYEIYQAKQFAYNKEVAIIGSGDVAYDYALNLQAIAKKISILRRTDKTSSLPLLQKRVKNTNNIEILSNYSVKKISVEKDQITLEVESEGSLIKMTKELVLVAIGRKPNFDFLSDELIAEYKNPVKEGKISFIGDIKENNFRQVAIAMGDGMKVAMETVKSISEKQDYHGDSRQVW